MTSALLYDVDSTIPNLALMHISAWRKSLGIETGWSFAEPDEVWASCVFKKNAAKVNGLRYFYPNAKNEKCTPLGIWSNEDIWQYIRSRDLPYCKIYDEGYNATGCIFCAFGIMQDRNRFVRLKATHPKQWEYCMRPLDKGGLGMEEVCDFLGIPTGRDQTFIKDFVEGSQ